MGQALGQECLRRIRNLDHALLGHLKDPYLVSRSESILDAAQQAVGVKAIALQIEHGIDNVLQHTRARDRPSLGHVTNQEQRDPLRLCQSQEGRSTCFDLADAPGRGFQLIGRDSLDRVHDHHSRIQLLNMSQNLVQRDFGHNIEGRLLQAEAVRAHLDLVHRFLARDIEHRLCSVGQLS